jgi:hypothetical protein
MTGVQKYQNNDKKIEQLDMRRLDMIVDDELRLLYIFSCHIDVACRSYLTKTRKILNWSKTMFKGS